MHVVCCASDCKRLTIQFAKNAAEVRVQARLQLGVDQHPAFFGAEDNVCQQMGKSGIVFRPFGARMITCLPFPGLAPWATFFRRFAATNGLES